MTSLLANAKMPKFSTLVAVFTLDRFGRRKTLLWGSCIMGVSMFLSGGHSRLAINNPDQKTQYGAAAATFTFVFTAGFGATWLTVPWLCPAEIFLCRSAPSGTHGMWLGGALEMDGRSVLERPFFFKQGSKLNKVIQVLLCPIMFQNIEEKTFYIFDACNAITIPIAWAL